MPNPNSGKRPTLTAVPSNFMAKDASESVKLMHLSDAHNIGALLDNPGSGPHHQDMTTVTKDLLDAKLETIETRMDARISSIETKIDHFIEKVDERSNRLEASMAEVRSDSKSLRWWLAGTAVATILGVYGANVSMVQTMLASFESGKNISTAQAEIKRQSEETSALLKQLQQTYPPPSAPTAPK